MAAVAVDCPEGTAPRLPNLVWVTYSDGYSEYRQVRWANSPLADEQAEADAQKHPAGSQYEIGGFVIGDETTDNGYPVKAQIKVVAGGYQTPEKEVAHTFSLADVSIDGDNRLTHNRDEAIREICSWDVTQQLYNYRDTYGLSTEGYTKSDGWDSHSTTIAIPTDSVPRVIPRVMAGIRRIPNSRGMDQVTICRQSHRHTPWQPILSRRQSSARTSPEW